MEVSVERFQILSLDGGGIRGLFSAAVLAAIEEDLNVRITDHFDLIAGTSTGGIVAIALGLGLRPHEIVSFYQKYAPEIFRNPLGLGSLRQWVKAKYGPDGLEASLKAAFGSKLFGESMKRLVIPTYNLGDDDVYIFRTPHVESLTRDYREPAWKVARATTAAPTFFPACNIVDNLRLIDGGVWANNPSMVALVEACGVLKVPLDKIHLLSIGTYDAVASRPNYLDWGGRLLWAIDAPEVLIRAGSIGVNNQVQFLLGKERGLRIDPKVPAKEVTLDGVSSNETLIGRAMHHSRRWMPEISGKFMSHLASPYLPCHSVSQGSA
jgi:uncharacterized protein